MYYFNCNLIRELPALFGMSKTAFTTKLCGIGERRLDLWAEAPNMSIKKFVDFLNVTHLSIADFLITEPSPVISKRKDDYVIPDKLWKPVRWHNERMAKMYGPNSMTGVPSKQALAKALGMANYQAIVRWTVHEESMKMSSLIELLNKYHLDAGFFFTDKNRCIRKPKWESDHCPSGTAESIAYTLEEVERLKDQLGEKDKLIADMQVEISRLKKENESLKEQGTAGYALAEPQTPYSATRNVRYVFHKKLWRGLPALFGKTDSEFCREFNIHRGAYIEKENIKMDKLIEVCNGYRISISHFFLSEGEPEVVYDRAWYEIPEDRFCPLESRMEDLKHIFRKDTFGIGREQLYDRVNMSFFGFHGFMVKNGKKRMVETVIDICNEFNFPLSLFVKDTNTHNVPARSFSLNEILAGNCIELSRKVENLKKTVQRLKGGNPEELAPE